HFIRVHPRGKTASTWVLNYNGQRSYNCIAGGGSRVQRCSSELNQTEQTWTVTLGETRFQFPVPTPDTPYRVIVQDASARFEWGAPDLKVIHQLYLNSDLDKKPLRAPTLRGIIAVQPAASRFLPLELQRCDASFLARCMANAPAQWLTYYVKPPRQNPWRMNSAHDPSPMHNNPPPKVMQNPAWLRHRKRCQREAEAYRETPYSCFPDKLGLAEANWAKLERVKLWYDTHHNAEIQLITPSDPLQPVWGNPTIGYYFFDQVKGQVFFKSGRFLNRDIRQFREFSATEHGAVFGSKVSRVAPGKDDAQLLVFEPPYYYLLTASRSGQLDHRVIAAETLDGQLSAPPVAATDKRLIPLRVVDSYDSRRILRTGFYDGATQTYIAFLSSLLDGGPLVDGDDGSRLRLISELVR
uniref:hypothetical protein n=1 Tax=Endozoicomonas sp. ONNA1 TaxID=2828740 RepID=UPI0021485688